MNLGRWLEAEEEAILDDATRSLARAHLTHYEKAGLDEAEARLRILFRFVRQSVQSRELKPMLDYVQKMAAERFTAGYNLHEVQMALNILEEAIWKKIVQEWPPTEVAQALGLISTVLGAGKDVLATTYVSLASQNKATTLNLSALFSGTVDQTLSNQ